MIAAMRTCALILLALLAACSSSSTPDTPKALADQIGCGDTYSPAESEELGVEAAGECEFSGQTIRLLTFANDDARDQFVEVAKGFGSRYVTGSGFAVEVQGAKAEAAVKDAL